MPFELILSWLRRSATRTLNRRAFQEDFLRSIPEPLRNAARFAFDGKATREEKALARKIESFRSEIASIGEELASFTSPHSGTFRREPGGRIATGELKKAPASVHANTGASVQGGILLRRLVAGLASRRILELGTNTGFSACYFLSAPHRPELVTVEGSADLCAIADSNLHRISESFTLMHALFDEALDELAGANDRFDCAFLDGQHEREATWHYTRKIIRLLNPGGAIIFDDIYWSDDMNQFWKEVALSNEFEVTVDLGSHGIGLLRQGDRPHAHYDICDYIGRPEIFRKGW